MNIDFLKLLKISIIMLIIDVIYLKLNNKFYAKLVKKIQNKKLKTNIIYATFAYLCMIISHYKFANSNLDCIILGLAMYGVWNGTNGAIFDKWNLKVTLIDTSWGILLNLMVFNIIKYI